MFCEIRDALRKDGRALFSEPAGHVSEDEFRASVSLACKAGLVPAGELKIRSMRSIMLRKE